MYIMLVKKCENIFFKNRFSIDSFQNAIKKQTMQLMEQIIQSSNFSITIIFVVFIE